MSDIFSFAKNTGRYTAVIELKAALATSHSPVPKLCFAPRQTSMWDTCAIDLKVQLPKSVAEQVRAVQDEEPELLSRMLMYAMARRTIFDRLARPTRAEPGQSLES